MYIGYGKSRVYILDNIQQIIKRCLKGDRLAQKHLYNLFADKMYALALRYSKDQDVAKDILQEGFIKVFNNLKKFNHVGSFEGWVRRIMVNTALERFRDKNYLYTVNMDVQNEFEELDYDHVLDEIATKDLMALIQELSPQYRTVFNLYVIEGYSHKEISKKLNIKEGTSKSNLSRAREILQEKIIELSIDKVVTING